MPLSIRGTAPSRGVYVEPSEVPGRSILTIVDSKGITRVWCEIDTAWCDEQAIWLAGQKLEQADPIHYETRAVGSPRLTLSSGGGPANAAASAPPSYSPRSDQAVGA